MRDKRVIMQTRRTLLLSVLCLPGMCLAQADSNAAKAFVVSGRVQKPGKYELREGMRVVDALKTAGDFLEDAQLAGIKIIRGAERKSFNYAQFAIGKRTEPNILLESGDVVVVS
jgi:protein involved in polysaccharide export with SLBB domain